MVNFPKVEIAEESLNDMINVQPSNLPLPVDSASAASSVPYK